MTHFSYGYQIHSVWHLCGKKPCLMFLIEFPDQGGVYPTSHGGHVSTFRNALPVFRTHAINTAEKHTHR